MRVLQSLVVILKLVPFFLKCVMAHALLLKITLFEEEKYLLFLDSLKIIKSMTQLKYLFRKNEPDWVGTLLSWTYCLIRKWLDSKITKPAIFGWWNVFNWTEFQLILAYSYETDALERSWKDLTISPIQQILWKTV